MDFMTFDFMDFHIIHCFNQYVFMVTPYVYTPLAEEDKVMPVTSRMRRLRSRSWRKEMKLAYVVVTPKDTVTVARLPADATEFRFIGFDAEFGAVPPVDFASADVVMPVAVMPCRAAMPEISIVKRILSILSGTILSRRALSASEIVLY